MAFKDSKYFREAHYLNGLMDKKKLKQLNKKIRGLDDHNRDCYELAKEGKPREKQVLEMIERMEDSNMASRLESLIMHDSAVHEANRPETKFNKLKLTAVGEKRLNDLINDRFR